MIKFSAASLIIIAIVLCISITPASMMGMVGLVMSSALMMTLGLYYLLFTPQAALNERHY